MKGRGGLGFRDLEILNLALLAKQIWRVITNPNLLVSKVHERGKLDRNTTPAHGFLVLEKYPQGGRVIATRAMEAGGRW